MHMAGAVLVAAFVMFGPSLRAAEAQGRPPRPGRPLTATGSQGITFGTVFPGVPAVVSRTDALNAGQFQIRGANNALVQVDFTLPAAMMGPGGATMAMVFGAADGGYSQTSAIGSATGFDPRAPLQTTLSGQGRLYLWLGGQLLPPAQIAPGAYSATITVTVTYL
jgi:hypothetical protein